jgi:hypothetical protein
MARKRKPFSSYIKIDSITNCWLWMGSRVRSGYGSIKVNGSMIGAHRYAMYLYRGFDLSSPKMILHLNSCPNKSCVNPEHLYIGTRADNLKDAISNKSTRFGTGFNGQ